MNNIQSEEILNELQKRVKEGEIKIDIKYLYDLEKYEFKIFSVDNGVIFSYDWDVKKSARYRKNYETFCLPLKERLQIRKYNKVFQKLTEQQKNNKN